MEQHIYGSGCVRWIPSDADFPTSKCHCARRRPPLGTAWTKPGEGASAKELTDALIASGNYLLSDEQAERLNRDYTDAGLSVRAFQPRTRTNLALTGHPLTAYDLKRIEAAK